MRYQQTLLGLPSASLNTLSGGLFVFLVCLGIRIVRTPNIALKVANTSLVTSNSASRLEELAKKLEEQAGVIQQKDEAYEQLQQTYNEYLTNQKNSVELSEAIEAVDELPQVGNINEIKSEINATESDLLEVITD